MLGLQEHRIVHVEHNIWIERHTGGVHLLTSSTWRNCGGVAISRDDLLVTGKAYNFIRQSASLRFMQADLSGFQKKKSKQFTFVSAGHTK